MHCLSLKPFYLIFLTCVLAFTAPALAESSDPLENLKPTHPRILINANHWSVIKAKSESDPLLAQYLTQVLLGADQLLDAPPLERDQEGRRLLAVAREALGRITILSAARHLQDDPRYARRAEREMHQLAAFSDWNPSHFLDVAEMTAALAIGYDWLYEDLSPASRRTIREGIVRHGLVPGLRAIRNGAWWTTFLNNWNQVCFGGLTLGALAVADEQPEIAREILHGARSGIQYGLSIYAPDGVYPEGPGYWGYGTAYQCLMIEALASALGTSWDLEKSPGFLQSAIAQMHLTGPTGRYFNFSDGQEGSSFQAPMLWFAKHLNQVELMQSQRMLLADMLDSLPPESGRKKWLDILPVLWWPEDSGRPDFASLPVAWLGNGPHPVAVFRTAWSDSDALYLAGKGGRADISHAHMDAGSFILEANGVRWAVDLGMQSYHELEARGIELWDKTQHGDRWDVFRLNNRSHNTLTINNQLHRVDGAGHFTHFDQGSAALDLSPVFSGQADKVTRRFEISETKVTISDHLQGLEPGSKVRWTMATRARLEVGAAQAMLHQGGKCLKATLVEGSDGQLHATPADPPADDFNAPNPGTSLLLVDAIAPASGMLKIEMEFEPQ